MKIVSLISENVKRITAVHIDPKGNLVEITGRNGQGKTSVLDSIWWALDGAEHVQAQPIRKGEKSARIILKLAGGGRELVVTRKFTRGDGNEFTTQLIVENGEGARFNKAQATLNELIGELSFDPLQFKRMTPREQFEELRQFVPGVDFDALDGQNKKDFERRTEVNRLVRDARAAANMILLPAGLPAEPIDEDALTAELQRAGTHNADIERRKTARAQAVADIARCRDVAEYTLGKIAPTLQAIEASYAADLASIDEQLAALNRRRELVVANHDIAVRDAGNSLRHEAAVFTKQADDLKAKLDAAPPLPETIDGDAIAARISAARVTNAGLQRAQQRQQHLNLADKYDAEAQQLTANIDARNKAKLDAVASAKMPVPGLSFGDGAVLMDDLPFEQASDAQQLRVSVAIAMAANPKLRVIRIRDGSLLDDEAMRILGEMCDSQDFQCWIETVASDGKDAFVIDDGHLASVKA